MRSGSGRACRGRVTNFVIGSGLTRIERAGLGTYPKNTAMNLTINVVGTPPAKEKRVLGAFERVCREKGIGDKEVGRLMERVWHD